MPSRALATHRRSSWASARSTRSGYGEDEGPFYRRLERDGWRRMGDWPRRQVAKTALGWLYDDAGWLLQPTPDHPALRMFFRGYYFSRGRVYAYTLDGYPNSAR